MKMPKQNIFETPDNYFDGLSNRTVEVYRAKKSRQAWINGMAAAAVFVIGIMIGVFQKNNIDSQSYLSNMDETMELYIQSGYWNEEDILSLADNPNDLLDQMLMEEWALMEWTEEDDLFENELFY